MKKKNFTLIELLVVVGMIITALVMGLIVLGAGGYFIYDHYNSDETQVEIVEIKK